MSLTQPTAPPRRDMPSGNAVAVRGAGSIEERYRSLFVIGRGGMGSVEVALERGTGGFERIVALKRLLPEGARDPRHKEMFLREARLAALLAHPNVVHAFAFGDLHGELFLAMEYVEGEPLSRVLSAVREKREGRLPPAIVAHVLAAVCDGLHAAHELRDVGGHPLNVVHRDLSPQNVMIAYEGHVKLLDFGVAKFDSAQSNTKTGEVKGKMAYMSPEQALGEPLDRRSDLWSLGAVLFECLSGQRMWGQGTDLELMRKLALEEPPRLDAAVPDAPRALVELQARLVARDRAGRPASARAVADELRAYLAASGAEAASEREVRGLMERLFAEEAGRQRAALTAALEDAAPAHVDALRKSLEPSLPIRPTLPATPDAKLSSTEGSVVLGPTASRGSRAGWVALAVVAVAGAALAALALLHGSGGAPVTTEAPASAPVPVPVPVPVPATASAPASASASATPTATAAAPVPRPSLPARPTAAPTPTAPTTSKLPHVDPTPF